MESDKSLSVCLECSGCVFVPLEFFFGFVYQILRIVEPITPCFTEDPRTLYFCACCPGTYNSMPTPRILCPVTPHAVLLLRILEPYTFVHAALGPTIPCIPRGSYAL